MTVRFVRNPAFEREMQKEPEFIAQMKATTTHVAVTVKAVSPDVTGFYKRHLRPQGNLVIAGDPFGHLVEGGSVNNPPYAPLRRGARAAGLRFIADPK